MQAAPESFAKQAARAAYGWGIPQSWTEALRLLERAAEAGETDAERQLALVTQTPIEELLKAPELDLLTERAYIGACRGFAPPGFSEWLIERSRDQLTPATTYAAKGAKATRTAQNFPFSPQERDLVLAIMQQRAAHLTRVPIDFHEPPNVISYAQGQEFSVHPDFLDPRAPELHADLQRRGQRIATIVTYLNEDFEGAETWFPDAEVKFRGRTGDAIAFSNVLLDGSPDYNTRHAGLPPTRGRKWVLSQWIRSRPFPYQQWDLR